MSRFRKKPVVIEAWQLQNDFGGCPKWFTDKLGKSVHLHTMDCSATIETLEGDMHAERGDWIIQGVKGELYPCKPDIFEATYDPEPPQ